MIKAIVFDFGGVFSNDTDSFLFQDIADKFKIRLEEVMLGLNDLLKSYQRGEFSDLEFWQKFSAAVGKNLPVGYQSLWIDKYVAEKKYDEQMFDFLRRLKQKGFKSSFAF